jgi:hypothetical protein
MIFHMRLVIAILAAALTLTAQDAKQEKQEKGDKGKGAQTPPTNLKVLKSTSRAEVGQIMRTFTVGLGVQCMYCHVQGNNASDENPKKEIARHMIQLVQAINATFPDNKMHVSCFTCHRGEAEPKTAPEPKVQ